MKTTLMTLTVGLLATQLTMCTNTNSSSGIGKNAGVSKVNKDLVPKGKQRNLPTKPPAKGLAVATFAGGCFWCMQPPYDKLKGVVKTTVGYTGGKEKYPTYKQVAYGLTGHTEAIQIVYDPKKVTFKKLLYVFWRNINPTQKNGQFVDTGRQYRTGIYYHNEKQRKLAEASKAALAKSGRFKKPIVVEIVKAGPFYQAEGYHQKFYKKNPLRYYGYRRGSGRDQYLKQVWGNKK